MKQIGICACAVLLAAAAQPRVEASGSALVEAARRQDRAAVEALIKRGTSVSAAAPDGTTALHWASHHDDLAVAGALVRAGAAVNAANQLGVTPLHLACENASEAMVGLLLKAGANPNAALPGRETPVMTGARVGSPAVMKLLLARGGNANAKEASRGQTALMWAAAQGHGEVVRLLAEAGADVRARTTDADNAQVKKAVGTDTLREFPNGFTPVLFAARGGDIESARALLNAGADINDTNVEGMTPLVLATVRGFPELAAFLLTAGADPNHDGAGYTALHWAVGTWETELTVRAITTEREGEWFMAAGLKKDAKLRLVKALLAHGADPNRPMKKAPFKAGSSKNPNLPELEGATPLILAAMAADVDTMRMLVAAGADPRIVTKAKGTILMGAVGLGHVQGEDLVKESAVRDAAELALSLGADAAAVDAYGNTALHYAAYMRHDSVIARLVERGAPLDAANKYGETALWASELVVQFSGGGIYQLIPSAASEALRKLDAKAAAPSYTLARPTEWPDVPRSAGERPPADRIKAATDSRQEKGR